MMNAVSLNQGLYQEAQTAASELGISLAKLYTLAVTEFINAHCSSAHTQYIHDQLAQAERLAASSNARWLSEDDYWNDEAVQVE
jgi:uncharacterized membrane protein affecting hemolysin expression